MDFQLPIPINRLPEPITYQDKLLLIGSCFTEHIGRHLEELKFKLLQNPHGILFDPYSVVHSLECYMEKKELTTGDLFQLNELWHSWDHHSRFSGLDRDLVLAGINKSIAAAHDFLKSANWLVITLGSSFSYRLQADGRPVANCHRAPGQWFRKHLMTIEETLALLDQSLYRLFQFNPGLKIIFTISPVRHIRDGVIENNRSKARLIEVVHHLVNKFDGLWYFPAYELVIDVLRDYRFYDIDMVHPNYPATRYVMERFMDAAVSEEARELAAEIQPLVAARKHRPQHPGTAAHQEFLRQSMEKTKQLQQRYPGLSWGEELDYFSAAAR